MELVDRYLQAVKFWLPKKQRDDIGAELSEEIAAQIAEREAALGRPVNESDVEAILNRLGSPVMVANRYLPQRHLIGPVLFPIYVFALKVTLLCVLGPLVLAWLAPLLHRAHLPAALHPWPSAIGTIWTAALSTVAAVTLICAVLERVQARTRFLEKWNPRDLAPVRDPGKIGRVGSTFEVAFNLSGAVLWAVYLPSGVPSFFSGLRITFGPQWVYFYWGFLLTGLAITALAAVNVWRPYWTVQRAALRLIADGAGSVLFCWLMRANIVAGFAGPEVSPARGVAVVNAINLWMGRLFPWCVVVCVAIAAGDIYRILQLRRASMRLPVSAMATALLLLFAGGASAQTQPALPSDAEIKASEEKLRKEVALDAKVLDLRAGRYRVTAGPTTGDIVTIERAGDRLMLKTSSTPPQGLRLHAENDHVFYIAELDLQIEYRAEIGPATGLLIRFAGTETPAVRVGAGAAGE